MSKRRVVITGLGLISPVGNDVETGWKNIVAGRSGIGPITRFDAAQFPTRFAGEVKGFDPPPGCRPRKSGISIPSSTTVSPPASRHFATAASK